MALARGAADEDGVHAAARQMLGLLFHRGQLQSAAVIERRKRRGHDTVQFLVRHACSRTINSSRGLISRTSTIDRIAVLAKIPKIALIGTCRSRKCPNPQ